MNASLAFYQSELKDRPLMPALLSQCGIEVPHSRLIRVPTYDDSNPSAYVYSSHIVDYGDDNAGYDLLKVAREWLGLQLDQAVALLASLAGLSAPSEFAGTVKQVTYRTLPAAVHTDPGEYALLATRAEEALLTPATLAAEAVTRYLDSRCILTAAHHYRAGVIDSTVTVRRPGAVWADMLTLPTWHHGQLLALKGRNLLGKGEGREMRNLSGAATAPYGLRELEGSTGAVLVVEGETDTLSVWAAYSGDVNVVGIPGVSHWKRLQHSALAGRPLYLCLDADDAGRRAMQDAARWAADEGRALTVLEGVGDKNEILCSVGASALRAQLASAAQQAGRTVRRRLA